MKRLWSAEELCERWSLQEADFALLDGNPDAGKLGLACQLAFWRSQGCFPDDEADIAPAVIAHLARQIDVPVDANESYAFRGRTSRRHRQLILNHLAVGEFDEAAEARFRSWLLTDVLPREPSPAAVEAEVASYFGAERVVRPGSYRLDRLIRSIRSAHDDGVLAAVTAQLDDRARVRLDGLLTTMAPELPTRGCRPTPGGPVSTAC